MRNRRLPGVLQRSFFSWTARRRPIRRPSLCFIANIDQKNRRRLVHSGLRHRCKRPRSCPSQAPATMLRFNEAPHNLLSVSLRVTVDARSASRERSEGWSTLKSIGSFIYDVDRRSMVCDVRHVWYVFWERIALGRDTENS